MASLAWILSIIVLHTVGGSPCTRANRSQNLTVCLEKIREELLQPNKYWFGSNYTNRCTLNEDSGVFCTNPKPDAYSIQARLFSAWNYTSGLDRFLELHFESGGKNYDACGNTFKTTEAWRFDADPLNDTVVYPWYVKNFPISVGWDYTAVEYYTLMVYDAGYLVSRGLYVNILGDDVSSAEIIQSYSGPVIASDIKNPFVFLLFKQNDRVSISNEWKNKVTTVNMTGIWTIEEFASSTNMNGIVAVNWITVTGDEWSAQKMLDEGGPFAMCPLFLSRAFLRNPRPFVPEDTELSVWMTDTYMSSRDRTITVCCQDYTYRARNFTLNPLGDETYSTWELNSDNPHRVSFTKLGNYSQSKDFEGEMYTMMNVDADSKLPSVGTNELPLLYGLAVNVVARNGIIIRGQRIVDRFGPYPQDDSLHYYYTLLYKQPSEVNGTALNTKYSGQSCSDNLLGRCLFDISRLVKDLNLTLVGASWGTTRKDAYVLARQLNETGRLEPEVCQGQPGYNIPCTTSIARNVSPSVVIIFIGFLLQLLVYY